LSQLTRLISVKTVTHFFMAKPCQRQQSSVDYFTAAVQRTDRSQCHCRCYSSATNRSVAIRSDIQA